MLLSKESQILLITVPLWWPGCLATKSSKGKIFSKSVQLSQEGNRMTPSAISASQAPVDVVVKLHNTFQVVENAQ